MNRDAQIPTREQLDALAALAMDSSDTDEDISPPHDSNEPSKETILRRTVSNRLAHAIPTHLSPLPPPQRTTIAEDKDGSDLFIDDDEDDFDSDSDDAFLFDTEKIFPYGFRLLSYNISCKANLDAEAKGFPKSIARAIYATGWWCSASCSSRKAKKSRPYHHARVFCIAFVNPIPAKTTTSAIGDRGRTLIVLCRCERVSPKQSL
eukprot:m.143683 g.143683  ORF g.143683 m.143683 type:complete len:206 (+) comp17702_c0_seq8:161-778(+)